MVLFNHFFEWRESRKTALILFVDVDVVVGAVVENAAQKLMVYDAFCWVNILLPVECGVYYDDDDGDDVVVVYIRPNCERLNII